MEIQIAVAKINQYGSEESGDTLEIVERPNGGVSVVMADAQMSGHVAKAISSMVVRKVISLLADGVRDSAAARAASDALFTERGGAVSAFLDILSADLQTNTLVISRNNPTPVYIARGDRIEVVVGDSNRIGTSRNIKPLISEISLEEGTTILLNTDGLLKAGNHYGQGIDICTTLESLMDEQQPSPQEIADTILQEAIALDQGRPNDDMSIVVLQVQARQSDQIRRMNVRWPYNFSG
ncbi:MAG: serine/threonine-protein phosphatase [Anaerolineae bacterium]|nr:serine/threonine-protein phosphatase [Anaerolineae bacterium]